jgi:hypothetical protein
MKTANYSVEDLVSATGIDEVEYFANQSAYFSARTDEEDNDDDEDEDDKDDGDESDDDNPPLDEKVVHSPLTTETGGKPKR